MLAIVLAAATAGGAAAHQDGCHSAHSCPSDHHTYVWFDANGQGWSCARPGSDTYDPARDTTLITYGGLPYHCYAVGSPSEPTPPTTTSPADSGATTTPRARVYAGRDAAGIFAQPSQRKPRQLHPFAADDNAYLYGLRWSGWGRATAHARGKAAANDCDPSCADGRFVRARGARAALYRRRAGHCHGRRALFYARARLHWPRKLHIRAITVKLRARC